MYEPPRALNEVRGAADSQRTRSGRSGQPEIRPDHNAAVRGFVLARVIWDGSRYDRLSMLTRPGADLKSGQPDVPKDRIVQLLEFAARAKFDALAGQRRWELWKHSPKPGPGQFEAVGDHTRAFDIGSRAKLRCVEIGKPGTRSHWDIGMPPARAGFGDVSAFGLC